MVFIADVFSATDLPATGNFRALLIGNGVYHSQKWSDLKTSVKDVEVLSRILQHSYGFKPKNVVVLKNAGRREILKGFFDLAETVLPDDSVLVYYAGHGESDRNDLGWWIPVGAEDNYDYISNREILTRLRMIKARHKILISDSCFSGNFMTVDGKTEQESKTVGNHKEETIGVIGEKSLLDSVQGISSGGDEPVSDGGPKWGGHSIFAYHLIAQLKANKRRYLTATALGRMLTDYVRKDTALLGESQMPLIFDLKDQGHRGGEFVFAGKSLPDSRKDEPIFIGFLENRNGDFQANGIKARRILFEELVDIFQRNGFRTVAAPSTISQKRTQAALVREMKRQSSSRAILVRLDVKIEEHRTRIWSALATLNARAQAYRLENDRLKTGDAFRLDTQKLPIDHWETNPTYRKKHYQKVMQKLARSLRQTDFAAYLRSSF